MKNILKYLLIVGIFALFVTACDTDEIDIYSGKDNIYFTWAELGDFFPGVSGRTRRDSVGYTFAFKNASITEMVVKVPISVQGSVVPQDREVKVVVDEASTAVAGTHFELPDAVIFSAGSAVDSIPVTLLRTPEMKTENISLILRLEDNGNFTTVFENRVSQNDTLSLIKLEININDILEKPLAWQDYYLGDFTAKKLFLINEILGVDPADFTDYALVGLAQTVYYGSFMQRYLNEKKAAGETVYEEDGTEMVMGPGVQ